jgi:hypothetical protein
MPPHPASSAEKGLEWAERRVKRIASSREERLAFPSRDGNQLEYTFAARPVL